MSEDNRCSYCGAKKSRYEMKIGWTNCLYCSEECERSAVSSLHASMPGGISARGNRMITENRTVTVSRPDNGECFDREQSQLCGYYYRGIGACRLYRVMLPGFGKYERCRACVEGDLPQNK